MEFLVMLVEVSAISNKPWSTTSNILALPKKWGTGLERDAPMQILAMLVTVSAISNKPWSTTSNILALPKKWGQGWRGTRLCKSWQCL